MNILIIEPYFAGSHKAWAQGYQRHSKHRVEILSLSGHHWKWRMHGGAVTLARKFLTDRLKPDIIVATDMLDVSTFLALTRSQTASIPIYLYFHENQITYPRTTYDKDVKKDRDHHYGWINFVSALSANRVYFNSRFHLETFYKALPTFLNQFPDKKEKGQIEELEKKSKVLLLGMDFTPFLASFPPSVVSDNSPLILWNHRWEYDKGPEVFFRVLWQLKTQHYSFRLAVLGESYSQQPPVFAQAQKLFKQEIIHWGYIESEAEYAKLLFEADVLPVTSLQDFFGMSVVEAMYANCIPLVPTGKVYEEHIPPPERKLLIYKDENDLLEKLKQYLTRPEDFRKLYPQNWVGRYDWKILAPVYDEELAS